MGEDASGDAAEEVTEDSTTEDSTTTATGTKSTKASKNSSSKTVPSSSTDSVADADSSPEGAIPNDAPAGSPGTPDLSPARVLSMNEQAPREESTSLVNVSAVFGSVILAAGFVAFRW